MSILKRILDLSYENHISIRKLEYESNIPEGYLNKAKTQTKTINSERLEVIYKTLTKLIGKKINAEWLLTNKGMKYLGGYTMRDDHMEVGESEQNDFEYKLITSLDNKAVQRKIKEVISTK